MDMTSTQGASILIVEDAADLAEVIRRELAASNYEVQVCADGLEAVDRIQRWQPDLVILDWMLPGIDGIEVLRRTRQYSAAPVLMLTARGEEADRVIGLEMGADDYLPKPFSMRELVARVRALLRRAERLAQMLAEDKLAAPEVLHWRGVTIDPAGYTAELEGDDLQLTRTEFDLLQLFARNPGRVFTREYLLDTVWGQNFIEGDRSVDNAILRLRKKLGPLGEWIEAVRGLGYRLRKK
jgi:DNA-binding response OmpR family regulator